MIDNCLFAKFCLKSTDEDVGCGSWLINLIRFQKWFKVMSGGQTKIVLWIKTSYILHQKLIYN